MTAGSAVRWMLTSRYFAVGTASAVAAVTSAVVTKKYLEQKLEAKYSEISSKEIHEAKAFYRDKAFKEGEFADPAVLAEKYSDEEIVDEPEDFIHQGEMVKEAARLVEEQAYTPYNKPEEIAEPSVPEIIEVTASIRKNIFDGHTPEDESSSEVINEALVDRQKDEGRPYVISHDDFFTNEDEWSETALSYFMEDTTLADERDVMIEPGQVDKIVGLDNLHYFGAESKDPNIVYIANPNLSALYEVTRSTGSYSQEVMGIPYKGGRVSAKRV